MKKRILLLIFALGLIGLVPNAYALSDIKGVAFEEAIVYLLDHKIISGYPDGTYKPYDPINRAEFSKIVAEAAFGDEIDPKKINCFPDVKSEWFAPYVCLLKEKNIINGYPNGSFIPSNNINFAEAAKIVINGFSINTLPLQPGQQWYQPYINALSNHNAIPFNLLGADQKLDRSQMAYMIYSLLNPNLPPANLMQVSHCQWPALATYDYFTDTKGVYYTQVGVYQQYSTEGFPILEGADPATLKVIACEVLKDNDQVFSLAKKTNLDGATFKLLSSQNFEFGLLYTYGQDKNGVYYFQSDENKPIAGVDVASFKVLEEGKFTGLGPSWYGFAKDKNTGYLEGVALPGSSGASFELIGENIAFDAKNVYVSKGGTLRIYENLNASPLLNMKEDTFLEESEVFFKNLKYQLYQNTELVRPGADDLKLEWYKASPNPF